MQGLLFWLEVHWFSFPVGQPLFSLFSGNNYDKSTGYYTAPVGGFYQFTFTVRTGSSSTHVKRFYLRVDESLRYWCGSDQKDIAHQESCTVSLFLNKEQKVQVLSGRTLLMYSVQNESLSLQSVFSGHLLFPVV